MAASEICIILHIIRKPTSIIVLLQLNLSTTVTLGTEESGCREVVGSEGSTVFIQNISKLLIILPPRRLSSTICLFIGTVSEYRQTVFFLPDTP